MTSLDRSAAADVACAAADAARREIVPRFGRARVELKSDGSPVTDADRAAELAIRRVLRDAMPAARVLGEEFGDDGDARAELAWVVDPIDGTLAFTRGLPLFGTIIALLEHGTPVVGVIDLPMLDERYVGWLGGGVRCNGRAVRASARTDLDDAIVSHGDAFAFRAFGEGAAFERLAADVRVLRGYTDAFGHAQVVRGSVDVMVDLHLSPWDIAATEVLVPEAGGRCVRIERPELTRGLGVVIGAPLLVERIAGYLAHRG